MLYSGWAELAVGTARRDRLLDDGALQPLGTLPIRAVGAVCREDQVWCCLARRSWESLYVCVRSRVCTRHGIQVEGRAVMYVLRLWVLHMERLHRLQAVGVASSQPSLSRLAQSSVLVRQATHVLHLGSSVGLHS